ncbi:hypothetical protein LCGC14_2945120 [marine sediment metagenome]|uniref:Uncharacterized protein n=1 Tax=marine sediment metagenome TaxID=412755 RepID=A0A0F8XHE7_9ZZZZ
MENLRENLDEIFRIINDIRVAQDFKDDLVANKNKVNIVSFGNGESVFTTLDSKVVDQMDVKIAALVQQLKTKVDELK